MRYFLFIVFVGCILQSQAQTVLDTVTVSASRAEGTLHNATRTVQVLDKNAMETTPTATINETLESISALDVRQRGPLDIQADISVRGGTFDQTLVLINGIRVNDPQTGHHTMNLPISRPLIEKIEVLEGGASRVYGPNAFAGAINLTMPTQGQNRILFDASLGEFGLSHVDVATAQNIGKWYTLAGMTYAQSTGYITNTDFEFFNLFAQSARNFKAGTLVLNAGFNGKGFGAQNFYSSRYPEQYEATKALFGSAKFTGGEVWKYKVLGYYREHHDRFELYRETDGPYRYDGGFFVKNSADTAKYVQNSFESWAYYPGHNYHRTRVTGAEAQLKRDWGKAGITTFGFDYRNEQIVSNNLGNPMAEPIPVKGARGFYTRSDARDNYSLYAEQRYAYGRIIATGGALLNFNSAFGWDVMPGVDLGYRITPKTLLYASVDRSFRFPTFTDLYYNLGGARGSSTLQPEYSLNYEVGTRWSARTFSTNVALFRREGKELIDWVQWKPDSIYAENLTALTTNGVTISGNWNGNEATNGWIKNISLGYTFLQAEDASPDIQSIYVLDYLQHKLVAGLSHKLFFENLQLNWRVTYQSRAGNYLDYPTNTVVAYPAFWLTDVRLNYFVPKFNLKVYAEASNLFNQSYVDRGNVAQPGLWLRFGFAVDVTRGVK
jgi:iron complex outermembrane receptor protein